MGWSSIIPQKITIRIFENTHTIIYNSEVLPFGRDMSSWQLLESRRDRRRRDASLSSLLIYILHMLISYENTISERKVVQSIRAVQIKNTVHRVSFPARRTDDEQHEKKKNDLLHNMLTCNNTVYEVLYY
jgi:hypothetical protein